MAAATISVDGELARGLAGLPPDAALCVAYSGGRDSTVLLDACLRLAGAGRRIRAVHVHHGLAAAADEWVGHCAAFCAARGVALTVSRVTVEPAGRGVEAAARAARYAAFAALLGPSEYLLTAHHADDQLETVLLHLARGSGVDGLAGIPVRQPFGNGQLWRPLLSVPGTAVEAAARARGLSFVTDPGNSAPGFDRNFLRSRAVPVLRERFPQLARAAARSAALAAEAAGMLADVAAADAAVVGQDAECLALPAFSALPPARQRNLLRFLARRAGLPPPPEPALRAGLPALLGAASQRQPALRWPGAWLRRYRDRLYLLPDPGPLPSPVAATPAAWCGTEPLDLGAWRGQVRLVPAVGHGIAARHVAGGVAVTFPAGGIRLRPAGDRHRRSLKYLCQTAGVVPWMRPHLPLLLGAPPSALAGQLLAVGDRWVAAEAAAGPGERAVVVDWSRHPRIT